MRGTYTSMQKRHFETIAMIIRTLVVSSDVRQTVARQFGAQLNETNPNFDWDRFVAACLKED